MCRIRPIQRFVLLFCTRLFLSLNDRCPEFGRSRTFFSSALSPFSVYRFAICHLEFCRLLVLSSRQLEMARAANSPVFGPSATVLKQSASNFFSDDVTPGRYGPLQPARQKFLFFAKFHNLTKTIFCCCSLHFTVLPTFRFTCFHANQ